MKLKLTKWMNGCAGQIEKEVIIKKGEIEEFMLGHFKKTMKSRCEIWLHGNCKGHHKIYAQIFNHKLFINVKDKMVLVNNNK